jgi:7-cyano-7-deazaguanine synthase
MSAVLLLCSGGLDSTTVAYWLCEHEIEVVPIFLDYGQHCVEKEWTTVQKVLPRNRVSSPVRVDISAIFSGSRSRLIREPNLWVEHVEDKDLYIPYRTLLFFSVGASYAQTHSLTEVYAGFINSNYAKEIDCSATFLNGLESLAADIGPVRFQIPFRHWDKARVVMEAERLRVPIGMTYSCQLLSDTPCGACPNCVDRLTAFEIAGASA